MDDCTRGYKPTGWRSELTVTLPMAAWAFRDLGERLSPVGRCVRQVTFLLLKEAIGLDTTEKQHLVTDRALIAGLEADGWQITTVRQTR